MPPQLEDRIASLKAKKQALAARLAQLETRAKSEERKRDTRRKIVVGAAVIEAMGKDPFLATRVRALLAQVVTRDTDLEIIRDLLAPPAPTPKPPAASVAAAPLAAGVAELSGG
jgi:polyphosphate kinase